MRAEYNFAKAKRGALVETKGKTRITIYIDNTLPDEFSLTFATRADFR